MSFGKMLDLTAGPVVLMCLVYFILFSFEKGQLIAVLATFYIEERAKKKMKKIITMRS